MPEILLPGVVNSPNGEIVYHTRPEITPPVTVRVTPSDSPKNSYADPQASHDHFKVRVWKPGQPSGQMDIEYPEAATVPPRTEGQLYAIACTMAAMAIATAKAFQSAVAEQTA